jgi:hypothetical protein
MKQEELRTKLNNWIDKSHIKAKYVAMDLGIEESVFCRFRKNTRDLYFEDAEKLEQFLSDK